MNQETNNETENDAKNEQNVNFEIPIITRSSPSSVPSSESISSPVYVNIVKRSSTDSVQSDEETDTSFTSINNNITQNGHVSAIRSLSPGNLNASHTSRGVMHLVCDFRACLLKFGFSFFVIHRMFDDGHNR